MKLPYKNTAGDSGISNYEIIGSSIIIEFVDATARYVYDAFNPGREHVQAMIRLAKQGSGLATYINQHVGPAYARKLPLEP